MTKALITGITGMVGSHLLDYLMQNTDWEIDGMIRWRSPLDNVQQWLHLANQGVRLRFLYGDLTDTQSIDAVVKSSKPDYVFHLAAQSFPQVSFDSPQVTYDTNIAGTERVLSALRTHRPDAIVHVCSSSEVFGRVSRDKLPINEDCTFHPASPYAISKVGTDLIGRYYAEAYGMCVMTTRMFTHCGPRRGDCFSESSFAKQIAMIEQSKIPPIVKVGNLNSLRTYADVRDAVRAYHMLVTVDPTPGAYYNIGGSYTCTIEQMLYTLLDLSNLCYFPSYDAAPDAAPAKVSIEQDKERLRPIDADLQVPDTRKFREHTGWRPVIPFSATMRDLLGYWRKRVRSQNFLTR